MSQSWQEKAQQIINIHDSYIRQRGLNSIKVPERAMLVLRRDPNATTYEEGGGSYCPYNITQAMRTQYDLVLNRIEDMQRIMGEDYLNFFDAAIGEAANGNDPHTPRVYEVLLMKTPLYEAVWPGRPSHPWHVYPVDIPCSYYLRLFQSRDARDQRKLELLVNITKSKILQCVIDEQRERYNGLYTPERIDEIMKAINIIAKSDPQLAKQLYANYTESYLAVMPVDVIRYYIRTTNYATRIKSTIRAQIFENVLKRLTTKHFWTGRPGHETRHEGLNLSDEEILEPQYTELMLTLLPGVPTGPRATYNFIRQLILDFNSNHTYYGFITFLINVGRFSVDTRTAKMILFDIEDRTNNTPQAIELLRLLISKNVLSMEDIQNRDIRDNVRQASHRPTLSLQETVLRSAQQHQTAARERLPPAVANIDPLLSQELGIERLPPAQRIQILADYFAQRGETIPRQAARKTQDLLRRARDLLPTLLEDSVFRRNLLIIIENLEQADMRNQQAAQKRREAAQRKRQQVATATRTTIKRYIDYVRSRVTAAGYGLHPLIEFARTLEILGEVLPHASVQQQEYLLQRAIELRQELENEEDIPMVAIIPIERHLTEVINDLRRTIDVRKRQRR